MKTRTQRHRTAHPSPTGFILLECLMAVAIFGGAALALMKVFTITGTVANESQLDLRMMALLQSELTYHSRMPNIRELQPSDPVGHTAPDEDGVWTETTITEIKDGKPFELKNEDNQELQQMFHVEVVAYYERDGQKSEMRAETIRYAALYRNTQTQ
jgi:type II secretory pathway pseudopilin PulG